MANTNYYTSTEILNNVFVSGTTLSGFASDTDILNAVYDESTNALRISGGGTSSGTTYNDASISTALSTEIVNRGSGDTSLSTSIVGEASTRLSSDGSLSTSLSSEIVTRGSVDSSLSTSITSKSDKLLSFVSTGASYTLQESDNGKVVDFSDNGTLTLPNGLSNGFQCVVVNLGSSKTITLTATTTLYTADSKVTITKQYGIASLFHKGSNVWYAFGDLV